MEKKLIRIPPWGLYNSSWRARLLARLMRILIWRLCCFRALGSKRRIVEGLPGDSQLSPGKLRYWQHVENWWCSSTLHWTRCAAKAQRRSSCDQIAWVRGSLLWVLVHPNLHPGLYYYIRPIFRSFWYSHREAILHRLLCHGTSLRSLQR